MPTNYLPGINVTLNDLGLKVAPPPAGPKVTLLGITSNTGIPIREPFTVTNVERALNSLYFDGATGVTNTGQYPGEIALAIEQAVDGGAENIEVVVIAHKTGTALMDYIDPLQGPDERYTDLSGAYEVLRNRDLDVVVPVGAYIDRGPTGIASANFGKQLADFCFQATQEDNACVGVISTQPIMEWALSRANALTGSSVLSGEVTDTIFGGDGTWSVPGTSAQGYLTGLSYSQKITAYKNVRFQSPSTSLVDEWVKYHTQPNKTATFGSNVYESTYYDGVYRAWLSGAADQNGAILDDITVASATAPAPSYFASWQANTSAGTAATDTRGVRVDAGAFINVFTAPLVSLGTQVRSVALAFGAALSNIQYNTDGASAYAGLINSLAPQSSTTNKQIVGVNSLKLLSVAQANRLTGMRHVTMYSRSRGLVVASGSTGAYNVTNFVRSDYVNLTTVRITHAAVDLIRSVADRYIGEANNAAALNAMDSEIDQVLLGMKGQGALNDYDFTVSSTPDQRVLGIVDINLTLVPAFEIRQINLVVSLARSL